MPVMSGTNATSFSPYFKNMYIDAGMMDAMLFADKWLARVEKVRLTRPVEGDEVVVPYRIGRSPAVSRDFQVAQQIAKEESGSRGSWKVKMDSAFGVGRVDEKTERASATNQGAFKRALQDEINAAVYAMRAIRCQDFFALKPNEKGVVASRSGSTITLRNKWQAVNFDINDKIDVYTGTSATDENAGTARAGNPYKVTNINFASGVITFDKAVNAAVAAGDSLIRDGDHGEVAMASLNIWLPKTLTGLGSLFGQNRLVNPSRLAGSRLQMADNADVAASVRKLAAQIAHLSQTDGPDIALMNPMTEDYVISQSDSKIRFSASSGSGGGSIIYPANGKLAFKKTNGGIIESVVTPYADPSVIWLLNTRFMALYYYGSKENNRFVDFQYGPGGNIFKLSHDDAGVEIRTLSFSNFVLDYPGCHGRVDL